MAGKAKSAGASAPPGDDDKGRATGRAPRGKARAQGAAVGTGTDVTADRTDEDPPGDPDASRSGTGASAAGTGTTGDPGGAAADPAPPPATEGGGTAGDSGGRLGGSSVAGQEAELSTAQADRAAERVAATTEERRGRVELLREPGGLVRADAPERVAARIDRLSRHLSDVRPVDPSALIAGEPAAVAAAEKILERVVGTPDFLGVHYLEAGAIAARAVGRINIRDHRGRVVGYGTGSLVTPQLLLTNHHVLPDAQVASSSAIEFDYQDGLDGRPLPPVMFALAPQRLFMADEALDYALVAVEATPEQLARFGFNRIIAAEGKAIVGDEVTIVQHPGGDKKQVALRENQVVGLLENFMHYVTDTKPGSSGSPVFNDQWEVVALHHASVPAPEPSEPGGVVNEGIRISRLVADIGRRAEGLPPEGRALVAPILDPAGDLNPAATAPTPPPLAGPATGTGTPAGAGGTGGTGGAASPGVGAPGPHGTTAPAVTPAPATGTSTAAPSAPAVPSREGITIDPDYANRRGYDPDFLGTGPLRVPLPELPPDLEEQAAINTHATSDPRYVLPYHHFSVVVHRQRRLAIFTSVNVDGTTSTRLRRERDRWALDPRLAPEQQVGEEVYAGNPLDRGHLVRRLDPAWGPSRVVAKAANDDTFHFTNCTPQHEDFNQNQTTWAGLEDYVLENADNRDLRISVHTGPVLGEDDEPYRGVALPRQFWKVVAMVKPGGELSATGYLLSQESLIKGLEVDRAAFSYGAYRTYQVPIDRIESLTRLSFGPLVGADPLARLEATPSEVEITRLDRIVL
jgi:endonuclease G